jgi:pyruvate dehydrogenase E2 component (dihydrolipoamide acetyltransferase)
MAFEVVMPRLGWNMEEGTFAGWRKADGDQVAAGEILFEVESDKALQECEALESGILRIPAGAPVKGTVVPVGGLLGYLAAAGEAIPSAPASAPSQAAAPANAPAPAPAAPAAPVAPSASAPQAAAPVAPTHPRPAPAAAPAGAASARGPAISPRARRVARELGVDWSGLTGSGTSGRIAERDVRAAAGAAPAGRGQPMGSVRRRTAERMAEAAESVAAVTLTTEVDATELVRLRGMFKQQGADVVPSYTDILARVCALALQEHPDCNARLEDGGVVAAAGSAIGVAVDTARGLLVPVIRDAQDKTLRTIAQESARLVEQARAGTLPADAMRGGTFTITNLGMYEVDAFTPIVNQPECAILGVGRIRPEQVVMDAEAGTLAIRQMAVLSLTFDHRIVDGAPAARFLQTIKRYIEKPYLWLAGT